MGNICFTCPFLSAGIQYTEAGLWMKCGVVLVLRLAKNNRTHVTVLRCMLLAVYFVLSLLNVYLSSTLTMVDHKTSRTQLPESVKNQFISAMTMSGNLRQSADLFGIKPSTVSDIWQHYKKTGCLGDPTHLGY
jgi:hypothetical protein